MELTFETFSKAMKFLSRCYLDFEIEPSEATRWYQILKKKFSDDGLFPVIFEYCKFEHAPTCPEDIIDFVNQLLIDAAPSADKIVDEMINSVRRIENKPDAVVPESFKNKMKASYRDKMRKAVVSQMISFEVLRQSGILK